MHHPEKPCIDSWVSFRLTRIFMNFSSSNLSFSPPLIFMLSDIAPPQHLASELQDLIFCDLTFKSNTVTSQHTEHHYGCSKVVFFKIHMTPQGYLSESMNTGFPLPWCKLWAIKVLVNLNKVNCWAVLIVNFSEETRTPRRKGILQQSNKIGVWQF